MIRRCFCCASLPLAASALTLRFDGNMHELSTLRLEIKMHRKFGAGKIWRVGNAVSAEPPISAARNITRNGGDPVSTKEYTENP